MQLQRIERVQTETIAKASALDIATANEPVNPLAPPPVEQPFKRRSRVVKKSANGHKVCFLRHASFVSADHSGFSHRARETTIRLR